MLAAGVGSRYGGPKQIDRVGPGGATLSTTRSTTRAAPASIARCWWCARAWRRDMREAVGDRIARSFPLAYAVAAQRAAAGLHDAAPGRTKPWGTGPRRSPRRAQLDGPFAVINADDFYGASSYRVARRPPAAARSRSRLPEHALVGFPLAATLSPDGAVSRGSARVDADGYLASIREVLKIERDGDAARLGTRREAGTRLPADDARLAQLLGLHARRAARRSRGASSASWRRTPRAAAPSTTCPPPFRTRRRAPGARPRARRAAAPGRASPTPATGRGSSRLLAALTGRGDYPPDLWA